MARIQIGETFLDYSELGSGEPVVLVHGSASDCRTWEAQRSVLARQYRVITYSRRYHHPNEPLPAGVDYSMEEQLQDLQEVLHNRQGPVHLVGHSYGAFLGLLLAIRQPHLLRSLVLAEPPVITLFVSNEPTPLELARLLATRPATGASLLAFGATAISPARAAAKRGDTEAALQAFGRAVLGREYFEALPPARLEQARVNTFPAEFVGSGFLPLQPSQVRGVQLPTLLVTGEHSPPLFHHLSEALASLLPRARQVRIPGASHLMHEDNPAAYNEAVLAFLASQRETGATLSPGTGDSAAAAAPG